MDQLNNRITKEVNHKDFIIIVELLAIVQVLSVDEGFGYFSLCLEKKILWAVTKLKK